jgi:gamma-glutamylcyclotransferase (GGCT)/AIG2-like uncharacterized protein YtfP
MNDCGVSAGSADSGGDRVAVYGTLKRGEVNHHWLRGARHEGESFLPGLVLHDLGPYPMAVRSAGADAVIAVEVYQVTAAQLERLDQLEDHPREYERHLWPLADGRLVWIYLGRTEQVREFPLVLDGCWRGGGVSDDRADPPSSAD